MPYVQQQILTEEQKKKAAQQANGVDVSNNNSTSFTQAQNSALSAPKPVANSGSWTNLQSYLDANKENTGAMADKIVGNVDTQGQKAQSGVQNLQTKAPGVVNKVNTDDWFLNPDANKKNEYATLKTTGGYNGPDSVDKIEGYTDWMNDANKADQQTKSLNTEPGRFNLLQEAYQRPQYSQGMKKLDNTLLRQDTTAKQKFEDTSNKWNGILNLFNKESEKAGQQINSNIQTALANKNDLLAGETKAKQDLINPITARATQLNQDNKSYADRILADAQDNILSDETLAALGLADGQSLYGLTPGSYVTPDYTPVGLDNAATAEERAKYLALAGMIDDPSMTQLTANGKAINPVQFNKDLFNKDLASAQSEYDNETNTNLTNFDNTIAQIISGREDALNSVQGERARNFVKEQAANAIADQQAKKAEYQNQRNQIRRIQKG